MQIVGINMFLFLFLIVFYLTLCGIKANSFNIRKPILFFLQFFLQNIFYYIDS